MTQNLLYAVLSLVFLFVGGVAVGMAAFWNRRYSPEAKALSGRLADIARQRQGQAQERLQKSDGPHYAPWLRWLMAHLPGVEALAWLVRRSGCAQSVAEVMALSAGLGVATALLSSLAFSLAWPVALLLGALALCLPALWLLRRQLQRRTRFEDQLPEALDFMTRALRAGYGLSVAMGMVGDELPQPLGAEFKTTFDQINLGMSFAEAMAEMADRVNSPDLNFLVIALMIQRKTGGNLTELLTSLAKTVRERIKLKGKVRVLASEGKLSGVLIGVLPIVLGVILSIINPVYMATLWTTESGHKLVGVGLVMMGLGALWMWKIVQIKV